ncbi:hypothetical protein H5410_053793 [Solanum commersonii]|uniref:Uncharacterized protein n=1 Tax=Solanum commersonii TaxID=4109 RepID=A0A9J5X7D3_SOLCO|nr:hypothetical protein H5410_053793 [Solanum commersonii]
MVWANILGVDRSLKQSTRMTLMALIWRYMAMGKMLMSAALCTTMAELLQMGKFGPLLDEFFQTFMEFSDLDKVLTIETRLDKETLEGPWINLVMLGLNLHSVMPHAFMNSEKFSKRNKSIT